MICSISWFLTLDKIICSFVTKGNKPNTTTVFNTSSSLLLHELLDFSFFFFCSRICDIKSYTDIQAYQFYSIPIDSLVFPGDSNGKEATCNAGDLGSIPRLGRPPREGNSYPFYPDAGKDWRQKGKGTTVNEMAGWHHWLNGREFEQAPGDGDGQGSLACCNPWGHKELDTSEQLNNNKVTLYYGSM